MIAPALSRRVAKARQSELFLRDLPLDRYLSVLDALSKSDAQTFDELPTDVQKLVAQAEANALIAAGDFDEVKHPRDSKGKFAKKAGTGLNVGKKLKITHMLVHKKYEPGTIIAVNGSDDKRVVWDGGKYLLQSKTSDGGWETNDTAIKTKAYDRIKEFDSEWHAPAGDDDKADITAPEPVAVKKTATSGKKSGGTPGSPLKITHMLIHKGHGGPGDVLTINGAGDKRVVWNGAEYELQVKPPLEGQWFTEKKTKKTKTYDAISAFGDDWRVPGDDASSTDATSDVIPDDFFDTPLADSQQTGPKFPTKPKVKKSGPTKKPFEAPTTTPPSADVPGAEVTSIKGYKKIGGQAGSNFGGLYLAPDGQKWYVKAPKTDNHARNEYLGNQLYQLAGVNVPQVELAQLGPDSPIPNKTGLGVKSKIVDGERNLQQQILKSKSFKSKLYEDFAVDAWLGNWDAVGLAYDNIITGKNGEPIRIDAGGSLLFRAQGMSKGSAFGDKVDEIDSLRKYAINPQSANIYGDVTDDDIRKGVAKIEAIQPEQIDALVDNAGFTGKTAKRLKDTLKARRADLVKRYGSGAAKPTPSPTAATPQVATPAPVSTPTLPTEPTPTPTSTSTSGGSSKYGGVAPKSMFDLTKVKNHKNGAIFADPAGIQYRVMPTQSEAHARSQFLAANLYNFTGVNVEQTGLVDIDPDKLPGKSGVGVKSKVETQSLHADVTDPFFLSDKSKQQLAQGFAIDAWLGNWNVAGTNGENLVVTKDGNVFRTNLGGALLFRASGGAKQLSDKVDEIDSLRDPSVNPTAAKIFANVTDDDIRATVAALEKLQPKTIDFIVDESGFTGKEADALKQKLKTRRQDLINRFGSMTTVTPAVSEPAPSGPKTFTSLQKAKVQSIFAKHKLKWHNKTHLIYNAALEVSKTHSDLTMADALDIMDQSLQKKTGNPFRTKVEKWLKTNAGMQYAIAVGGSAPLGSTASKVPGSGASAPGVPGKPLVDFATPLPRNLTPKDADTLQERMDKAWPPPWTSAQRSALKQYTGASYQTINGCLRGLKPCSPVIKMTIENIKNAMKPSTDNIVVYRKTNANAFGVEHTTAGLDTLHDKLSELVGKTFEDQGVISTSITNGVWSGIIRMEIEVPKGAKIAWVKRISNHTHENELVLMPGTRFEVISVTAAPDFPGGKQQLMKLRVVVE